MAKKARSGKHGGMRDEMNVGPDPRQARHLVPLKELGRFHVVDGDPDIRGWEVYTSTGREIGRVEELLVDTDTNEVVMLDVDLRRDDRHTLAPLRAAWIDRGAKRVVIDARELQGADEIPSLSRTAAMSDDELRRFDEGYGRAYGSYHDDRELRLRHGQDELRFGRRAGDRDVGDAGGAREPGVAGVAGATGAAMAAGGAAAAERRTWVERRAVDDAERYRVADRGEREVRLPQRAADPRTEEVVVERRPVVEEVVVRRRILDEGEQRASDPSALRDGDRDGIPDDRDRRP